MVNPEKISPDLIADCAVDIRFRSELPSEAVFGVIYSAVKASYSGVEPLPITQLPKEVLDNDPNLHYKPTHRLHKAPYFLQIGPRALVVSAPSYPGWAAFSEEVSRVLALAIESGAVNELVRVGLRYINFLQMNVLEKSSIDISVCGAKLRNEMFFLRTSLPSGKYTTLLQVSNEAAITVEGRTVEGSIIDLDTSVEFNENALAKDMDFRRLLDGAHGVLKDHFFDLLLPDFLKSLNPTYSSEGK